MVIPMGPAGQTAPGPLAGRFETPIALVGPPNGGKTTFLLAVLHGGPDPTAYGEWRATPPEDTSDLVDEIHDAIDEQRFPGATPSRTSENWTIRGEYPERLIRKGVMRRTSMQPGDKVEFNLMVVDPPGSDFLNVRTNGIVDVLAGVEGIILLIDPTRMMAEAAPPPNGTDNPPTYRYLNRLLRALDARLLHTSGSGDGWLPHRVSVCVSKFDHPAVYQRAKQLGLVDAHNGGQPGVTTGDAARTLFESICRSSVSTTDADIPDMIKKYFQRGRVSYHVISAIGFYTDPMDGFREDDSGNVIVRGGQPHIRRLQPTGVWESLIDLFEAIRQGRTA